MACQLFKVVEDAKKTTIVNCRLNFDEKSSMIDLLINKERYMPKFLVHVIVTEVESGVPENYPDTPFFDEYYECDTFHTNQSVGYSSAEQIFLKKKGEPALPGGSTTVITLVERR